MTTLPKLALIPSGYKASKVYSALPTNGDGDFTFSRTGTATRVNENGLIETVDSNVPRLDYLDSNCPSLLLEPQRTNLITYSEDFANAVWTKKDASITNNSAIAPDGTLTADKLIANTVNASHYLQSTVSGLSTSSEATFSVFVKKAEISQLQLLCAQNTSPFTNWARLQFDLNTLSEFSTNIGTFGYEEYPNGWLKIFVTGTPTNTSALIRVSLYKNFSNAFAGNDSDGFYLFGAQLEQGNYPTSYIPTNGEVGGVTRTVDKCLNGGDANLFNDSEGTFFVDVTPFKASAFYRITLSDGTTDEEITYLFRDNNTQVTILSENGGVAQVSYTANITFDTRNKLAFTFKNNEFKFYVNGSLVHTDTSGTITEDLNSLHFAGNNGAFNFFEGKVHDTRVYDRVLTEAEAIELTT